MRVAVLQFEPRFGQVEANHAAVLKVVGRRKLDLLVLPELFASGYTFASMAEARALAEPTADGPTTTFLRNLARRTGGAIVAGMVERAGRRLYNSAVLVTAAGGLAGLYRKVHLFEDEKRWFTPGDLGFPVFQAAGTTIGMMVCFDWIFPEAMRTLALAGAQIVAHPANLVLPFCQDAMITRSLENRVFVLTANRTGTDRRPHRTLTFTGRSQIVAPGGKRVGRMPRRAVGLLAARIDPTLANRKRINPRNDLFEDRRPSVYALK